MSNNKNQPPEIVTLIEDPFRISTLEISDAQNNPEELHFNNEINEETNDSSEPLEEQLDRLARAVAQQTDPVSLQTPSHVEDESIVLEEPLEIIEEIEVKLPLDASEIQSCIESLLFISEKPLSIEKLHSLLGPQFSITLFNQAIQTLTQRYQAAHHGIEVLEIAGGYQFRTKPERAGLAQKLAKTQTQRISSGGMESLAIIAYKQPIMKEEIDKIRGVDSSYFIRGLIEKKMIKITGRSELPGRPILYSTTDEFLEVFGLKNLSALPSLRELEQMIPTSQSSNPEDEDPRIRDLRKMVGAMKADRSSHLHYNPEEDEKILKEIKERVSSIPSSTPYLDELKAAETAATENRESSPDPSDKK